MSTNGLFKLFVEQKPLKLLKTPIKIIPSDWSKSFVSNNVAVLFTIACKLQDR